MPSPFSSLHYQHSKGTTSISLDSNLTPLIKSTVQQLLQKQNKIAVITSPTIAKLHPAFFTEIFPSSTPTLHIPDAEENKNFHTLQSVCNFLADHQLERSSSLFIIGGGVTGDVSSLAASIFKRGIPFYQIPTTLMAMADSSIGGKSAINLPQGKNLLGSFHHPNHIFISTHFLQTLPPLHFHSAFAEIIKAALIQSPSLFNLLSSLPPIQPNSPHLLPVLSQACQIKASIVQQDENESLGPRKFLNLGHTFAHAIEAATNYSQYLHAETVSIGLHAATLLSQSLGDLSQSQTQQILHLLHKYNLPTSLRQPIPLPLLKKFLLQDKKNLSNLIHFVLLKSLGSPYINPNVPEPLLNNTLLSIGAI